MTLTHARTKTPKYPKVNMPSFFLFKAFVKTTRSLPKLAGSFLSFQSFCLHVSRTQNVPTWYEPRPPRSWSLRPWKGGAPWGGTTRRRPFTAPRLTQRTDPNHQQQHHHLHLLHINNSWNNSQISVQILNTSNKVTRWIAPTLKNKLSILFFNISSFTYKS